VDAGYSSVLVRAMDEIVGIHNATSEDVGGK
jgi:hypothetical protein